MRTKCPTGRVKTIEDFWNVFVEPNLPCKEIVIEWHKILSKYITRFDAVLGLRVGNAKENPRRGFETKTTDGYSFFLYRKWTCNLSF